MTSFYWRCCYINFWCLTQSRLLNMIDCVEISSSNHYVVNISTAFCGKDLLFLAKIDTIDSITCSISNKYLNKYVFPMVSLHQRRFHHKRAAYTFFIFVYLYFWLTKESVFVLYWIMVKKIK